MKKPKIVFLVMSAVSKPATIDQLAYALAPHLVLVHHDFSQTPEFHLTAPNVRWVPNPKRTGWAVFGFVEGIFHSLRYAIEALDFDYLQLLSPTCLPIKSLSQFEAHVSGSAEAHFDCVDLRSDRDALMSVGYRAFTPQRSLRHRIVRRLSLAYFGASSGRRDEAGIWLRSGGGRGLVGWIALATLKALGNPQIGRHIFDDSFHPYCGTAWFGARRHIIAGMVEGFADPVVHDYFSRLRISEEFLIPSLLMRLKPRKGPMNHFIQVYEEAHPGEFHETDVEQLRASRAFFARKFPDDPTAPVRVRVLGDLAGADAFTPPLGLGIGSPPAVAAVPAASPRKGSAGARSAHWGASGRPAT